MPGLEGRVRSAPWTRSSLARRSGAGQGFVGLTIFSAYLVADPASPSGIGTIGNAEALTFQS